VGLFPFIVGKLGVKTRLLWAWVRKSASMPKTRPAGSSLVSYVEYEGNISLVGVVKTSRRGGVEHVI
jgi:hypothetical protein